jgi:hypothetical protein
MYIENPPYVDKNRDEVRAMPVENIMAAKELLEHNQSPAALEMAVKLMTKALVQQVKAMSSRRLESDPALCRSSTASKAWGNGNYGTRPDNESHTGSSEAKEEKLVTGQMPSQYPPMISHMAKAIKEIHRHPTRTILLTDTTKTRPYPAISPTCHHQSTRRLKSHREEFSYTTMMASEEGVVTLARETSRHDVKPVGMAGPSIGNHLAMMTVRTAAATRISIALPAAMTMTQLHEEQREAAAVAEIHHRTSRVKGVTLHHSHQAAPMTAAVAVAAQPGHAPPKKIRRTRSHMTRVPT